MGYRQRHREIQKMLAKLRYVSVQELTDRLAVSEVTIRKDLTFLEEMGYLFRIRGGAELAEDSRILKTLSTRRQERLKEKQNIARKARELVREGDTIFIDAGSSCLHLAQVIRELNLRVITNSIDAITVLAECPGISLICLGGNYRKDAGSFIGPVAMDNLKNFHIETCFLGATGFTGAGFFSCQNIIESRLKSGILLVSKRRVILSDSSKFGNSAFSVFARPQEVDVLVTDQGFNHSAEFIRMGVEVLIATAASPAPDPLAGGKACRG